MRLRLTAFEEYMLADDRPAYPMDAYLRMRFSAGRFDRAALAGAFEAALARHPLATARVQCGASGRREWVAGPLGPPPVCWVIAPAADAYPPIQRAIDLRTQGGVRLLVADRGDRSDLVLHYHHACCDGLGAFQVMTDLLRAYSGRMGVPLTGLPAAPRAGTLRRRGTFGLSAAAMLRMVPKQLVGLLGVRSFLQHRPLPLAPARPCSADDPLPAGYPATVVRHLTPSELLGLRGAARRLGVTLNDLLTRDVFLALQEWRERHYPEDGPGWLRLSLPVNLRGMSKLAFPAANLVSMVFLDRRPQDMAEPDRLLRGIHAEMQRIKNCRLGLTFVLALQAARMLPGGIARTVRADRCAVSCVFSNFGEPLRDVPPGVGDGRLRVAGLVLEGVDALAPMRPYTWAAFAALAYAGGMSLALHYDPRVLSPQQARDLADGFAARAQNER
jgi:hypothetical protein